MQARRASGRCAGRTAPRVFLWGNPTELAESTDWPFLREARAQALNLPLTGMAVAIDVGEAQGIHLKNKVAVGERHARHALKFAYDQPAIASDGPQFRSVEFSPGQATVRLDHATGLRTRAEPRRNPSPCRGQIAYSSAPRPGSRIDGSS